MRIALAALLMLIVGSCPVWCATIGPDHAHAEAAPDSGPSGPVPVNDDDCVCNGAILATDSPADALSTLLHPAAPLDLLPWTIGDAPVPSGWDASRPAPSPGRRPGPGPSSRTTSLRC